MAGSEFNLTCMVSELISGLTGMPDVMWMRADGDAVPGAMSVTRADGMAVAVLTFDPVRTSYSGGYICTGSLVSPTKSTPLEMLDRVDVVFISKLVLLMQCFMLKLYLLQLFELMPYSTQGKVSSNLQRCLTAHVLYYLHQVATWNIYNCSPS